MDVCGFKCIDSCVTIKHDKINFFMYFTYSIECVSVGCVNRLWFINAHMLVLQSSIKAPGFVIILTYCSMLLLIKRRFDNTLDINLHNSSHTYKLMLRISATFLWLQQSYSFKTRWHHFVINQWLFKKSNTILNKASLVPLNRCVQFRFNFSITSLPFKAYPARAFCIPS